MNAAVLSSQPTQQPVLVMPVPQHNGLGIAGFLIAFVGLFIPTGVVALLGLILSVAALGRPPRVFAILGVLLGLIGVLFWGGLMVMVVLALLVAAVVLGLLAVLATVTAETELVTVTADMFNIGARVVEVMDASPEHGLPALDALGLPAATQLDPWGNPYRLIDRGRSAPDIVSNGPDGLPETEDDLHASRLEQHWERAFEALPSRIRAFAQRQERLERAMYRRGWSFEECCPDAVIIENGTSAIIGSSDSVAAIVP